MGKSLADFQPAFKLGYGVLTPVNLSRANFSTSGALGEAALPAANTEMDRWLVGPELVATQRGIVAAVLSASYSNRIVMAYTGALTAGTGFQFALAKNGDTTNYVAQSGIIVPAATTVIKVDFQLADARNSSGNAVLTLKPGDFLSLYMSAVPAGLTVTQITYMTKAIVSVETYSVKG